MNCNTFIFDFFVMNTKLLYPIGFLMIAGIAAGQIMSQPVLSQQKAENVEITLVSYAVTRSAYEKIIPKFVAKWQKEKGQKVTFKQSYGGSGSQTRAVIDGLGADVVQLALESDVDKIQKAGLIQPGWQKNLPTTGLLPNRSLLWSLVQVILKRSKVGQI